MNHASAARRAAARRVAQALLCLLLGPASALAQRPDTALLTRVQSAALSGNDMLRATRARQATAEARLASSGRGTAASLDFDIEEVPGGLNVPDAGSIRLGLRRDFLRRGVGAAQRALASVEVADAARAMAARQRWVEAQVELALLTAAGDRRVAQLLAAEDTLLSLADDALRVRFATGSARYVDVLRLRTERLRVQSERLTALGSARAARRRLDALVGTVALDPPAAALLDSTVIAVDKRLDDSLPALPPIDSLILLVPAVARAELAVQRAEAMLILSQQERRPAWSGGVGVQRFGNDDGGYTLGPTLGFAATLPFTNSLGTRTAVEAARLGVDEARAAARAAIAVARAELVARMEAIRTHQEQVRLYESAALRGAREERDAALSAYRAGELPLIELLDFERVLRQAEVALLRERLQLALMHLRARTAIDDNLEDGVSAP